MRELATRAPRWRRRKTARPDEIIDAAFAVFAETGFAAAKLDAIARRAGISKGALYLYFETKEELFRAVVRRAIAPDFGEVGALAESSEGSFASLAVAFLSRAAAMVGQGRLAAVVKMVIGEFPKLPGSCPHLACRDRPADARHPRPHHRTRPGARRGPPRRSAPPRLFRLPGRC